MHRLWRKCLWKLMNYCSFGCNWWARFILLLECLGFKWRICISCLNLNCEWKSLYPSRFLSRNFRCSVTEKQTPRTSPHWTKSANDERVYNETKENSILTWMVARSWALGWTELFVCKTLDWLTSKRKKNVFKKVNPADKLDGNL